MANELTPEAQERIAEILKKERYDKAQPSLSSVTNKGACLTCGCSGGNGMVRTSGVYMRCPTCSDPIH